MRVRLSLSVPWFVAFSCVVVVVVASCRAQDEAQSERVTGRLLTFPEDQALGTVSVRPAESNEFGYQAAVYRDWRQIGLAQGMVSVPPGHQVRVDIGRQGARDLSSLMELAPDAIDALRLHNTGVRDDQIRYVGHLAGLQYLDLRDAHITDLAILRLSKLHRLKTLLLSAVAAHREGFGVGDRAMRILALLPSLEQIDLRYTKITDRGLASLARSRSLQSIDIDDTQITDVGLQHLLQMPQLRSLRLGAERHGSRITDEGMETVGRLRGLRSLRLSGTQATNFGMRHLAGLSQLKHLSMEHTRTTELGLKHLVTLQNLETLRLSSFVTDLGAKHLSKLRNLKQISTQLSLTDDGVADLAKLPRLEQLSLSDTGITDKSATHVAQMTSLKRLRFQDCPVSNKGLARLAEAPALEDLRIGETQITTAGLKHLTSLPRLRTLALNIEVEEESEWGHLADCSALENLRVSGADFDSDDLQALQLVTQLTRLTVDSDRPIDDAGVAGLATLGNLIHLDIEHSTISDKGLSVIANLRKLQALRLSCFGTDQGLAPLKSLQALRRLQVGSPYFSDAGVQALAQDLPGVQLLRKTSCHVNDRIVSRSPRDDFLRVGERKERLALDEMEGSQVPSLLVDGWVNNDQAVSGFSNLEGKVVLVVFWHNDVARLIPELKTIREAYVGQGLVILGIHATTADIDLDAAVENHAISWPIAMDVARQSTLKWNVHDLPTCFLIDRKGTMRVAGVYEGDLSRAVQTLLAE